MTVCILLFLSAYHLMAGVVIAQVAELVVLFFHLYPNLPYLLLNPVEHSHRLCIGIG